MQPLKKYAVFFSVYWQSVLNYRFDSIIYTLAGVVTPLLGLFIWLAVKNSSPQLAYQNDQIVFYFLAAAFCGAVTNAWGAYFIATDIRDGSISGYLTRPFSILENFATNNIAEKVFKVAFLSLVLTIVWNFFSYSYHLFLPIHFEMIPLAVLALLMAAWMMILLDVCMGFCAFWFHDVDFITGAFFTAEVLFSGKIVPLVFFPDYLQIISILLPFRYAVSFPIELALGQLNLTQIGLGFTILIFWTLLFGYLQKQLYLNGTKRYGGYGG